MLTGIPNGFVANSLENLKDYLNSPNFDIGAHGSDIVLILDKNMN